MMKGSYFGRRYGRYSLKLAVFFFMSCLLIMSLFLSKIIYSLDFQISNEFVHENNVTSKDFISSNDLELNINTDSMSESDLLDEMKMKLSNLPIDYWLKLSKTRRHSNARCGKFPSIYDVKFNNMYWQSFHSSNGTFQLYGAYFDDRQVNKSGSKIRILGMFDRIKPINVIYCQVWLSEQKEPVTVNISEYSYIWYKAWGNYYNGILQPYLMTCNLPQLVQNKTPVAVSLVERPCDHATNMLKITYKKQATKKDFAVCVKGLLYLHNDISVRLIEWIEFLKILGADKISFYVLQAHPNITKVLNHYQNIDYVSVTPITLAGNLPNLPAMQELFLKKFVTYKRQSELIPYNDCFYRHMHDYKYVSLLDIDEVIVPMETNSWREMMDVLIAKAAKLKKHKIDAFNFRNVYFLDNILHNQNWIRTIPNYMHMLHHVHRSRNFTRANEYVKSFINTDTVLTVHNHFPFSCYARAYCRNYGVAVTDAKLHHYRSDCVQHIPGGCKTHKNENVIDMVTWKYKNQLIDNVTNTLKLLGYFAEIKTNRRHKIA